MLTTMEGVRRHTCGIFSKTLSNLSFVLEIYVPALGLTGLVLQRESEYSIALLNGILSLPV